MFLASRTSRPKALLAVNLWYLMNFFRQKENRIPLFLLVFRIFSIFSGWTRDHLLQLSYSRALIISSYYSRSPIIIDPGTPSICSPQLVPSILIPAEGNYSSDLPNTVLTITTIIDLDHVGPFHSNISF